MNYPNYDDNYIELQSEINKTFKKTVKSNKSHVNCKINENFWLCMEVCMFAKPIFSPNIKNINKTANSTTV